MDASLTRPTADDFLSIIRRQQLGKLIYLGACPGVGKTYAMLREGHRLKDGASTLSSAMSNRTSAGDIAQIGDLEIVPPRLITYRDFVKRDGRQRRHRPKADRSSR